MLHAFARSFALAVLCTFALATAGHAQVSLKKDASVYLGSPSNTTAPATIDVSQVRQSTPEWQTIQSEGVRPGTARYLLLDAEMDKRIRAAVRAAAADRGKDLVVAAGDIDDRKGKEVADLTAAVVGKLGR